MERSSELAIEPRIVGKKFEDLSEEDMSYIAGGDGATPASTPITSLTTFSVAVTTSATVSAAVSLVSYTVGH